MRAKSLFAVLVIVLLLPISPQAQKPRTRPSKPARTAKKTACADLMTQGDMNRCAVEEYKKADEDLNRVYQQTMAKLSEEHKLKLKAAQLAWIQFRDADCDCEAFTYEGGSMQPLIKFTCLASSTKARIQNLKSLAEDVSR